MFNTLIFACLVSCGPAPVILQEVGPGFDLTPAADATTNQPALISCPAAVHRAQANLGMQRLFTVKDTLETLRADLGGGELELRIKDDVRDPLKEIRVGVRWRLPRPGERGARVAASEAGSRALSHEASLEQTELAAYVRELHLAVRRAKSAHLYAVEALAVSSATLAREMKQLSAGLATRLGVDTAALRHHRVSLNVTERSARHRALQAAFRQLVGYTPDSSPCVCDTSPAPTAAPPLR
jgi:outer membrane protein TolC